MLFRIVTIDGVRWSDPEMVLESTDRAVADWVSPSILKKDGTYKMWYVAKRRVWYIESNDLHGGWTEPAECSLSSQDGTVVWHQDVIETCDGYEMLSVNYEPISDDHKGMSLYHACSEDGIDWTKEAKVLDPGASSAWDSGGLYRSTFLRDDDGYRMIYSAFGEDGVRGIGLISFSEFDQADLVNLRSAYGDSEAYHPSFLSFDSPWGGYRYWCSFSPYPHADDSKENPHVLASNDLKHWDEPDGFANPLDGCPEDYLQGVTYNSDPTLFYNNDANQLECWWRYVDDSSDLVQIKRRCTADGRIWSPTEVIIESQRSIADYISPSVLYEDHLYKVWSVGLDGCIQYSESENAMTWSPIRISGIPYETDEIKSWHIDVNRTFDGDDYEMVVCAFDSETDERRRNMCLYQARSSDGLGWYDCDLLLTPEDCGVDNVRGLYKSCFVYTPKGKGVLFSYIQNDETRGVALVSAG